MPPIIRFLLLRILFIPLTLLIVTASLMALLSVVPPGVRAIQYLSKRQQMEVVFLSIDELNLVAERPIREHHLDAPFPVQYAYWLVDFFNNGGGYSPSLEGNVLEALLRRTPVTAELTLFSLLVFIPLGIAAGLRAGWGPGSGADLGFRGAAYVATSLPPFITSLVLIGVFYVILGWFPPGRLGLNFSQEIRLPDFTNYTGMVTVDSLLNGRLDIFVDALRHLILPVVTLSMVHWATLGRIVRSTILVERRKDYLTAARARGIPERSLLWQHALRNALTPALSSSALAAASLFTGVFMIEIIFDLKGVADLVVKGSTLGLDVPVAMGFSVYSVGIVLVVMFVLDVLRAILDPRARESLIHGADAD